MVWISAAACRIQEKTDSRSQWLFSSEEIQRGMQTLISRTGNTRQQFCQDLTDVVFIQIGTADRQHRCLILLGELFCHCLGGGSVRIQTVQQDGKGLSQFLQLCNDTLFALGIFRTGQVGDAAVSGDYQPDGGVLCNDFPRADFCRHVERDFLFKPRGMYHTRLFIFDVA